jgi:hypothetical protein
VIDTASFCATALAWRFGERCRGLLPWSGRAGCEEKEGWLDHEDFARAAHTIELSYSHQSRSTDERTPATPEIIRVNAQRHEAPSERLLRATGSCGLYVTPS